MDYFHELHREHQLNRNSWANLMVGIERFDFCDWADTVILAPSKIIRRR
jgi:hypothetical protein